MGQTQKDMTMTNTQQDEIKALEARPAQIRQGKKEELFALLDKANHAPWTIGDAALKELGEPTGESITKKERAKLKEVIAEVVQELGESANTR
jgi:hypothetical protein